MQVRPSIALPRVPLPSLDFAVESRTVSLFSVEVLRPKPEAPWLNRLNGAVQFTEAVVDHTDASDVE